VNYAFTSDRFQKEFIGESSRLEESGLHDSETDVKLINPLNEEINVMRRLIVPSLYRNCVYNFRSGNQSGRLFEVGVSVHRAEGGRSERYTGTSFGEEARIGFCFWGGEADLWGRKEAPEITMVLNGVLDSFIALYGIANYKVERFSEGEAPSFLHPGKSARLIVNGTSVGFVGAIHPSRVSEDKLRVGVAVAELNFEKLMVATKQPDFAPLSNFQAVDRDVAFVTSKDIAAGDIVSLLKKTARGLDGSGGKALRDLKVFDVFEGPSLGTDKRSVAVRMTFQSSEATLDDETVNGVMSKLVDAVCQTLGAVVRG
jgi:phenylalanyl-tRNA synthetase beta chain